MAYPLPRVNSPFFAKIYQNMHSFGLPLLGTAGGYGVQKTICAVSLLVPSGGRQKYRAFWLGIRGSFSGLPRPA